VVSKKSSNQKMPASKVTLLDYKNLAQSKGGKFISEVIPIKTDIKTSGWVCVNKHDNFASYQRIKERIFFCESCDRKRATTKKKTLEDYRKIAEENKMEYILGSIPKNVDTSIEGWECSEGHIFTSSYTKMRGKPKCTLCTPNQNLKRTIDDYIVLSKKTKIEYMLKTIPQTTHDDAKDGWKCKCGALFTSSFTNIEHGRRHCRSCSRNVTKVLEDYKNLGKKSGCEYILDIIPKNTHTKAIDAWKCTKNKHVFSMTYKDMHDGNMCNKCSRSSLEQTIELILDELKYEYQIEYRLDICPNFRFDLYLSKYNLLIELDGAGHFLASSLFCNNDINELHRRQNVDIIKTKLAIWSGMKLIRMDSKFIKKSKKANIINFINHAIDDKNFIFETSDIKLYDWIHQALKNDSSTYSVDEILNIVNSSKDEKDNIFDDEVSPTQTDDEGEEKQNINKINNIKITDEQKENIFDDEVSPTQTDDETETSVANPFYTKTNEVISM
jgi:hypothetical protein